MMAKTFSSVLLTATQNGRGRATSRPACLEWLHIGLQGIAFDESGTPQRVTLQTFEGADIIVDPRFSFGQPVIEDRGVRVEDVAQLFFAGEPISVVGAEFGIPEKVVEAIVRNYGRPRVA